MKNWIFILLFMLASPVIWAQDLPENPEPGKCYVRCTTPDVWETQEETIEVKPAYTTIVTHPAEYKTVTERVLLKEASQKLEIVPAVYETIEVEVVIREASHRLEPVPAEFGTKTVTYTAKPDATALNVVPATFLDDTRRIMVKSPSAFWKLTVSEENCISDDPNDCQFWCYTEIPAQYANVALTKLDKDAFTVKNPVPGEEKTFTYTVMTKPPSTRKIEIPEETTMIRKTIMKTPPTTRVIEIPAEYTEITKTVLVKDAWEEVTTVPAVFETIQKEVLVKKGGLSEWKEVECELINYNPLPINWNLNSATLTTKAKKIIDERLLPLLKEGLKVELASHTDSRGSDQYNMDLSDRRANSVKTYLISKGISPGQLLAKGYGETKLLNRCKNGVDCTEEEHLENRRTEFRVLNN
jgi:outer membrane protein OmpA-like peptidoglycan-associated protein